MLKKKHHTSRHEVMRVVKKGKSVVTPHFSFRYLKENNNGGTFSLGIAISKKIIKQAVARNRLKRRGYAIVRDLQKHVRTPFVGLLSIKKDTSTLSPDALRSEIEHVLHKAGLI